MVVAVRNVQTQLFLGMMAMTCYYLLLFILKTGCSVYFFIFYCCLKFIVVEMLIKM